MIVYGKLFIMHKALFNRKRILCYFVCAQFFIVINANHTNTSQFQLHKNTDSLYVLQLITETGTDTWRLPYPVYQFSIGDVNNDGNDDALVGVIKRTRYDSTVRKRIFIFKNYNGHVRALWMGSRLGRPIVDFRFYDGVLRSIEEDDDGLFLVAEYRWSSFGMDFIRYLCRGVTIEKAQSILYQ